MGQTIRDLRVSTNCASCKDNCCSQPYDWVYVTEAEISRLVKATGKQEGEFIQERESVAVGRVFKALELPCAFLDKATGKCTVYEARPLVCRLFPFYPDPVTGHVMFYPAQCGENLVLHPRPSRDGWDLSQFDGSILQWVRDIWREALLRNPKHDTAEPIEPQTQSRPGHHITQQKPR